MSITINWPYKSCVRLRSRSGISVVLNFGYSAPDSDLDAAELEPLDCIGYRTRGREEVESDLLPMLKRLGMFKALEAKCWDKMWTLL